MINRNWGLNFYQAKIESRRFETWYGSTDDAIVVNQAGNWEHEVCLDKFGDQWTNCLFTPDESLMFDSDPNTFWHSQENMEKDLKIIGVKFKVSCLNFLRLKIH